MDTLEMSGCSPRITNAEFVYSSGHGDTVYLFTLHVHIHVIVYMPEWQHPHGATAIVLLFIMITFCKIYFHYVTDDIGNNCNAPWFALKIVNYNQCTNTTQPCNN